MGHAFLHVHSSWESVLVPFNEKIEQILTSISNEEISPSPGDVFAACQMDLAAVKCVIIGQDPYPTRGNAQGLAFSVPSSLGVLPPSLRNIFTELVDDLKVENPQSGDLTPWRNQGVLLLNRVLTTKVGESNAHLNIGWQEITSQIAAAAAANGAVGILWGKSAQELSYLFSKRVESAHPSPLSAYRGFFGSKPFSKTNKFLTESGSKPINWEL